MVEFIVGGPGNKLADGEDVGGSLALTTIHKRFAAVCGVYACLLFKSKQKMQKFAVSPKQNVI